MGIFRVQGHTFPERRALASAGVERDAVNYVNAHATSTQVRGTPAWAFSLPEKSEAEAATQFGGCPSASLALHAQPGVHGACARAVWSAASAGHASLHPEGTWVPDS